MRTQAPTGAMGICVEACSGHGDCDDGKLCCSNGCGHVCKEPVAQHSKGGSGAKHVMMVTLAHKDSAEKALAAVPKPANVKVLSSVGIMILTCPTQRYSQPAANQQCRRPFPVELFQTGSAQALSPRRKHSRAA